MNKTPIEVSDGWFTYYICPKCSNKICLTTNKNKPVKCEECGIEFEWEKNKRIHNQKKINVICSRYKN